ncbi:acyl-CoA dehydrogenase family protein [Cohnella mopanensis]|uniref:acyl-CoA dehydrogenase family protein n=1 Tax=Cohnella mopanensis TaxID=2911966 RepID=UPI001EF7BD03|nr:acyl-CoA dehydrogenase family protein [Cohnella mopanensis]
MGHSDGVWGTDPSAEYEQLALRFRSVFDRIRNNSVQRERERKLLYEEIEWLREAGIGAVRVPREEGGAGATLPQLFNLLLELAEAESNLPQALRIHYGFVERILNLPKGELREKWLKRIVDGDLIGNALTEIGEAKVGSYATKLTGNKEHLLLNGTKYYSTGTIYSDWIVVSASDEDENLVSVIVSSQADGVTILDDWDGFGQTLTGSGTTTFLNTPIQKNEVLDTETSTRYGTAFVQMVHLATLAGIARAAAKEVTREVGKRQRTYSHAAASRSSEDPQVLQVVGAVHSLAYAAGALVQQAAESVQRAYDSRTYGDADYEELANIEAEIEVAQAQTVITKLTLDATELIFNALGASATARSKGLDRYWRNARTIASHNPLIYKERVVGDYTVNGTSPPFAWRTGNIHLPEGDLLAASHDST